jgi:hypothetical protein
MFLHEAMVAVLSERGGWMDRDELAREIADRDLYRQRAGTPAPSDQLRLRARKYEHLFEGSDNAYTRIRLRTGAMRSRAAPAQRRRRSLKTKAQASAASQDEARRRRARAAIKYKPDQVKLLLVAEAPPAALDRYFYFEDVRTQDSLFRYVARSIVGVEPTRENKRELLERLRDRGVFLIDLSEDPVDGSPLSNSVADLVRRAQRLKPDKIVLIKASVYDAAFAALLEAGLPVVDERVPFPGSGQQRRFEVGFTRALKARPDHT